MPETFVNLGYGQFSLVTTNFDNDADVDVAADLNAVGIGVRILNDGTGNFSSPDNFAHGGGNQAKVISGDFDGDGDNDLVHVSYSAHNVTIMLNDGSGIFSAPVAYAAGSGPSAVTAGDFDGDGDLDLAVANEISNTLSVLLNQAPTSATVGVSILAGWNMISNPVTRVGNTDSVRHLYPNSIFNYAFAFNQGTGYVQSFTMPNGTGFWEKFPASETNNITGIPRTSDSISVSAGWNMVGTISSPVDTATIVSVPAGLRASEWFGYSGGYSPAAQLTPGKAYWVKSNGVGKFVLTSAPLNAISEAPGRQGFKDIR
jgi:hypothetical protein